MRLLALVWGQYRLALLAVLALSAGSAALNIVVLGYLKSRLMSGTGPVLDAIPGFAVLLVALFGMGFAAQSWIAALGHRFVHELRRRLVKQLLDTAVDRLETLGAARLLASLGGDVQKLTLGFINLPEVVYGLTLGLGVLAYLLWLSVPLALALLAWLAAMLLISLPLMRRTETHIRALRDAEDALHEDYQGVVAGRQELALNQVRAKHLYEQEFLPSAEDYFRHIVRADTCHWTNGNWVNAMILASIALICLLANAWQWADATTAATFALVILFARAPLLASLSAIPNLLGATVALDKLEALALADYRAPFLTVAAPLPADWQTLEWVGLTYRYAAAEGEGEGFSVGPCDLTIHRGERIFLIGGNGSGKSTLARLLTGLYPATSGSIRVDGQAIANTDLGAYQQLFSTVFSDFHLFRQLLGPTGQAASETAVDDWLSILRMEHKVRRERARLLDLQLSQGQRKRLGLLLAALEGRAVLLLDEWAADQDPAYRRAFYRQVLPRLQEQGVTVLAITHDEAYFPLADRVLKMLDGRLLELPVPAREGAES